MRLRLYLRLLHTRWFRLLGPTIGVLVSTAFLTATLLATAVVDATGYNTMLRSYGNANLILTGDFAQSDVDRISHIPGVTAAEGVASLGASLNLTANNVWVSINTIPASDGLRSATFTSGSWPKAGEIVLPESLANSVNMGVGAQVTLTITSSAGGGTVNQGAPIPFTVSGVAPDNVLSPVGVSPSVLVSPPDVTTLLAIQSQGNADLAAAPFQQILVRASDSAIATVRSQLANSPNQPDPVTVSTVAESLNAQGPLTPTITRYLLRVAIGLDIIALLVASLVIANNFQVTIATRRTTIGLLRSVGASVRQVRRLVLFESLAVGLAGAIGGLALGFGLVGVTMAILRHNSPTLPLPIKIPVSQISVWLPLIVGVLVSVAAAFAPAATAGRVSPLESLRPTSRAGEHRLAITRTITAVVAATGAIVLAGLAISFLSYSRQLAIGAGITSGFLMSIATLSATQPLIKWFTGALARLRLPPSLRLAVTDTHRQPRRAAAAANALFIGIGLVALLITGATAARAVLAESTLSKLPTDMYMYDGKPVLRSDLTNTTGPPRPRPATPQTPVRIFTGAELARISETSKVVGVSQALQFNVTITAAGVSPDGGSSTSGTASHSTGASPTISPTAAPTTPDAEGKGVDKSSPNTDGQQPLDLLAINQETMKHAVNANWDVPAFAPNQIAISTAAAATLGVHVGQEVQLSTSAGVISLQVAPGSRADTASAYVDESIAPALGTPTRAEVWIKLAQPHDRMSSRAVAEVAATLSAVTYTPVVQRSYFSQVIEGTLLVVFTLIPIALIVTLVGISNTLAISVLERRREYATLRALGMTRPQMRRTLAWEGLLITAVGTALGLVGGVLMGWLGTKVVLEGMLHYAPPLTLPPILLVVAVLPLLAGLAASVLPSRAILRMSHVEGLSVD